MSQQLPQQRTGEQIKTSLTKEVQALNTPHVWSELLTSWSLWLQVTYYRPQNCLKIHLQ